MIKRIFSILCLAALLSGAAPAGLPAAVEAAPQSQALSNTCFLPVVSGPGCAAEPVESPFSLQVAAEHQLAAPGGAFSVQGLRAEIEAQARVDAAYPYLSQALADSGAGWTRLFLKWSMVQPNAPVEGQPPQYKWDYYDKKFKIVADTGVKIIMTVAESPAWAAPASCAPIYPDRLDEYAQFLKDLVKHYKQPPYNVRHWEIVNEPDNTGVNGPLLGIGCWGNNAQEYAQALAAAYRSIKSEDPQATVLMGGLAYDAFIEYGKVGGPFDRYFADRVLEAGGGNSMDAFNFHYFPGYRAEWESWTPNYPPTCGLVRDGVGTPYDAYGIDIIAKTNHFRNRMKTCFGVEKPVWLTETAEHGYEGSPASLDQQARYVIQGHARGLAAGITNITWYALVTVNDNFEQGLLFPKDWSPKPAFTSYRTLTSELKNFRYAETRDFPGGELYVFKNSCGEEKLAAWNAGSNLKLDGRRIREVDYLGKERFIQDGGADDQDGQVNGVVSVRVTAPVFLHVR